MTTVLIATRSRGKQREIREIFRPSGYELVFPDDVGLSEQVEEEALEDAETFEGNARRKAEYFVRRSGLPTAAEDSGIEVFSLGGLPGVRSRRLAALAADQDAANNAELLRKLRGAPPERRRARYRSVIVFVQHPGAVPQVFEGACTGTILQEPRGKGGFGYDPLFLSDELGKSFGEASPEEKHAVSHRGRALRAFANWLACTPRV
ncbi:MAG: non-canonical purine NTP pyrophosphatase [Gemmatimonadetes bacterium]|nr:non-canonical purine NTP pyrophosphatase [Gemmatimonadota bacterium]